jgi:hypothetical protein
VAIRKTGLVVVIALLINAAGLLLCQWECVINAQAASSPHAACHKAQDEGAVLQTATDHDCLATATTPAATTAKSVESAKQRIACVSLLIARIAVEAIDAPSFVSPPGSPRRGLSISTVVLRI